MAKWRKQFEQWKNAKSPVSRTEVETLLNRIFTTRIRRSEGTSHEFIISVPELQNDPEYQFGQFCIPIRGGQQVKAPYLQRAYRVATSLELYSAAQATEDQDEDHEQGNYEGSVE